MNDISTHTLTWSVTILEVILSLMSLDFNSHAHVERDKLHLYIATFHGISTHTLTWSVTQLPHHQFLLSYISTHTLTWSVTMTAQELFKLCKISTHTLTWSVTWVSFTVCVEMFTISTHTLTWSVTNSMDLTFIFS